MSITSTLNINQPTGSIVLTIFLNNISIRQISYYQSSNTVMFSSNPSYTLSGQDELSLINQYVAFTGAIINNFSPSSSTQWWTNVDYNEYVQTNGPKNNLVSVFSVGNSVLISLTANGNTLTVTSDANNKNITIQYCEFLFFITCRQHFGTALKTFFNL